MLSCGCAVCQLPWLATCYEHLLKIILALRNYIGNQEGNQPPLLSHEEIKCSSLRPLRKAFPYIQPPGGLLPSRPAQHITGLLCQPCFLLRKALPHVTRRDRTATEVPLSSEGIARPRSIKWCLLCLVFSHSLFPRPWSSIIFQLTR